MKILHYFLGFPPYRSGGLTKYCCDLMQAQLQRGDRVAALWPGAMGFVSKQVRIRRRKQCNGVESYELINPLPVPLDEGIADIPAFTAPCDPGIFMRFLSQLQPDVIHIHTLMGLYCEMITAAKQLHIRTVFTTHDYFGLCPKVTMFRADRACPADADCAGCDECNRSALSVKKIRILQSGMYRQLKDTPLLRLLRRRHRQNFFSEPESPVCTSNTPSPEYQQLRSYYLDMLRQMDVVHFNSSVSKDVYLRFFTPADGRLLSITHRQIFDRRQLQASDSPMLRLTYLAPAKPFKGFTVIRQALDDLWAQGRRDFTLQLFGPVPEPRSYMQVQENGYQQEELPEIFANTDVLLAPSVWYETFGFTVLEALSHGVPVIISKHVGARDILQDCGILIPPADPSALTQAIASLTPDRLAELRQKIRTQFKLKSWDTFIDENYTLYRD